MIQYHPAQALIAADPRRFKVVCCGRKFGKTRFGGREIIERMSKGQKTSSLAPVYEDTRVIWDDLTATLSPDMIKHQDASRMKMTLTTGGTYQGWSMDGGAINKVRPHSYDFILIDEAAFVINLLMHWQKVLRATLARYRGEAWFLSTPDGFGDFHTLAQKGIDPNEQDWAYFNFPTASNPHIPPEEIEEARRDLPENIFNQEFLARFIKDGSSVFRGIEAVILKSSEEIYRPGARTVIGVDWGKKNDFTVIVVIDVASMQVVAMDRFNHIDYHIQRERLKDMINAWQPVMTLVEENNIGETNIEELLRDGVDVTPFMTTGETKRPLIEDLSIAIEKQRLHLLPDPVLLAELQAYTMRRSPSGRWQYDAPSGGHDDCVIALALAYRAALDSQARELPDWLKRGYRS